MPTRVKSGRLSWTIVTDHKTNQLPTNIYLFKIIHASLSRQIFKPSACNFLTNPTRKDLISLKTFLETPVIKGKYLTVPSF